VRLKDGPPVELRQLRYFLVVSEELHFRRAAERLYMAQPPLSLAIKRLEEALGVQLFNRTSRAVTLTKAGRAFADEARKVLATVDLAVAEAQRAAGGDPNLQIGCTPYLPTDVIVRFLYGLHKREPRVRPQIKHLLAFEQEQRLRRGELDLGIFPTDKSFGKLGMEPLVAAAPLSAVLMPGHPLAEKTLLGPADLAGETLVSYHKAVNPPFAAWLNELEGLGYRFRGLYEAGSDSRDVILAVAAGAGVALFPSSSLDVGDVGTIVVSRPLDPPLLMPETVVAWRTRPPAHLRALIPEVRELARGLREGTGDLARAGTLPDV
jgi:DNA-binding transcriptional LysR family regulator